MAWQKGKGFYQRFWEKIDQRSPDECWSWLGCRQRDGYGLIRLAGKDGGKTVVATRVMMVMKTGKLIPPGFIVMHLCDNPPCVNPAHLSIGTSIDNMQDMMAKGRQPRGGGKRLSKDEALAIYLAAKKGDKKYTDIASRFDISQDTVSDIATGRTWNSITNHRRTSSSTGWDRG